MAEQEAGRTLVIKRGDGTQPEKFAFVCGFRSSNFYITNQLVDVSVPDPRNPLGTYPERMAFATQSITFSGGGLFDSDDIGRAVSDDCKTQAQWNYQVIVPGWKSFTGVFTVENVAWDGAASGNLEFEATFRGQSPLVIDVSPEFIKPPPIPPIEVSVDNVLLEDGFDMLQETMDVILVE